MWYVESYCDVELGIFSSEEKARAALVAYHGNETDANSFGRLREFTVDVFEDGNGQQMDYRDKAPTSPVQGPGQQPVPNVTRLPQTGSYSPAQALGLAMQEAPRLARLLVVGEYNVDGQDNGELYVLASRMSMLEVVWLEKRLGAHIDRNC